MTLVSLHAYKYCLLSLHLCANMVRSDDTEPSVAAVDPYVSPTVAVHASCNSVHGSGTAVAYAG